MKIIKKSALSLILAVLAISLLLAPISVSASTTPEDRIFDRDGNLAAYEESRIASAIAAAEKSTGVIFLVAVYDIDLGIPSGEEAVRSFGFSYITDDVVLLMVKCDDFENYYEMFTYGEAYRLISDRAVNRILDSSDVYDNIKGGNLSEGIVAFVNNTAAEIERELSGEIYFDSDQVLVMLGISLAAGIIAVVAVIIVYKTKLKSPIYPLSQFTSLNLTEKYDQFIGKTVTRTKISSSSSGSSSSGRSGGSSGGSRGGR